MKDFACARERSKPCLNNKECCAHANSDDCADHQRGEHSVSSLWDKERTKQMNLCLSFLSVAFANIRLICVFGCCRAFSLIQIQAPILIAGHQRRQKWNVRMSFFHRFHFIHQQNTRLRTRSRSHKATHFVLVDAMGNHHIVHETTRDEWTERSKNIQSNWKPRNGMCARSCVRVCKHGTRTQSNVRTKWMRCAIYFVARAQNAVIFVVRSFVWCFSRCHCHFT